MSLGVAFWLYTWVKSQPSSNKQVQNIGELIRKGANTFLRREYKLLARFAGVVALLILVFLPSPIWSGDWTRNLTMAIAYICGTALSALAGKIGIQVATIANVKAAEAAPKGIRNSFMAGFRGGAVMGMAVVGLCLFGVTAVLVVTGDSSAILGFSFGASSLALFAKAGGGIFTKAADISADLVGKVELDIPEDDPRNPAVIADNVGDNVGDVAGMGADLFDSNVASMAAALIVGETLAPGNVNIVLAYSLIGLLSSIVGVLSARMGKSDDPTVALNKSTYITTAVFATLTAGATYFFGFDWAHLGSHDCRSGCRRYHWYCDRLLYRRQEAAGSCHG